MKKPARVIETFDPVEFKKDYQYVFPFEVLDKTPGGGNLGRIQWLVELHPAKKNRGEQSRRIGEIWVWAKQTRDPRYQGKIFKIETWAESLTTAINTNREKAYAPWRMAFCEEHKGAFILDAYPETSCKELVIEPFSSISLEVKFR